MKRAHEIDAALREVAERRDKALSKVMALSSARQRTLTDSLARQFPVETTLREVTGKRDRALHPRPAMIPPVVDSILLRELAAAEPPAPFGRAVNWLGHLRSPLAAVLTAFALVAAALLGLGRWEASRRNVSDLSTVPPRDRISVESGMELFAQTVAIGPFNLNTSEPASLQVSFLANRRIRFLEGNETPLALRLDLPVSAALMEDGFARTP
jgi:hypothetical protein